MVWTGDDKDLANIPPLKPFLPVVEMFTSIQGEGYWAGTVMSFIRFLGCSVGKKVCTFCDTDFGKINTWANGGHYSAEELVAVGMPTPRVCLTGGEPLDHDIDELLRIAISCNHAVHIETSGTVVRELPDAVWVSVSPKPGYKPEMIERANEIKIIVGGPGSSGRSGEWPLLGNALMWAKHTPVYLQPCNHKYEIDQQSLQLTLDLLRQYPELRLSIQLHKVMKVR